MHKSANRVLVVPPSATSIAIDEIPMSSLRLAKKRTFIRILADDLLFFSGFFRTATNNGTFSEEVAL